MPASTLTSCFLRSFKNASWNRKKKVTYVEYEEDQDGYRRIIASPKPIDIYEIDAIKALVDAHQLLLQQVVAEFLFLNSVQV